ncbi:MAG TPA: class I SAM-dependent methyltransferase [Thermoanaerobaculia bacterium]|nr:class I SAM-dependent methyltransferase [Thermoanaerobaculia bacterium]
MSESRTSREAYQAWHRPLGVELEPDAPWHRMIRARLEPGRDLAGRRVLEIGCGRGDFACWMARQPSRPQRVVAADFASVAVERGRRFAAELGLENLAFTVADIERLPFETASFDTVVSCETVEHVPSPPRALLELARVLRPGGRLFLSTPNYFNVWAFYRGALRLAGRRFSEAGQPINQLMLAPRTLAWVRGAGLEVEAFDGVQHTFPTWPGRAALSLPALERARPLTRWFGQQTLVVARRP